MYILFLLPCICFDVCKHLSHCVRWVKLKVRLCDRAWSWSGSFSSPYLVALERWCIEIVLWSYLLSILFLLFVFLLVPFHSSLSFKVWCCVVVVLVVAGLKHIFRPYQVIHNIVYLDSKSTSAINDRKIYVILKICISITPSQWMTSF